MIRLAAVALIVLSSCARAPSTKAEPEQLYALDGTIVRLDAGEKVATIKHGRIRNEKGKVWMEPMTMEFPVRNAAEFSSLQVGQRIRATLHERESDFAFWIAGIQQLPDKDSN